MRAERLNLGPYMTSYPSPSYDPYRNISPYANQNSTGVAREMQLEHERMLEMRRSHDLSRMANEVRELRYNVDRLESRFSEPVRVISSTNPYSTYLVDEPEPSVEVVNHTPSWLSRYWHAFITDPFWEFLRRPSIK